MSKRSKLIQEEKNFKSKLDKIDEELKKVSDKADTKDNIIKDITIFKNNWIVESTMGYTYEIKDSDISGNDVVDINLSLSYVASDNLFEIYSATTIANEVVRIYAKKKPTIDLNATMVIHKGAI